MSMNVYDLQDEFQKELEDKYSFVRNIYCGNSCPPGWFNLVRKLCKNLHNLNISELQINQIKEKFGGLRVYVGPIQEKDKFYETHRLINEAELASTSICQVCGKSGKLRNMSWIKTLCEEHYKE